jgi:hypothetical protein
MPPKPAKKATVPVPMTSNPYKNFTILVPEGTDLGWYATASPEEVGEALALGATLHTTVKNLKAGEAVAELEARQATELATVRSSAEERIAAIQAQLETAVAERASATARALALFETQRAENAVSTQAEKDRLQALHATRISEAQAELQILKERISGLEVRRKTLEEGREVDIRVAEERTRTLLQQALDEKERTAQRLEATLTALQASYATQSADIRALTDLIRCKQQNVRMKGTAYENEFRAKLMTAFGLVHGFKIADSARSSTGHAADYLTNLEDHTVMWETKDYDRPVPLAEVEKFRRDMKENHDVRIGVMVSRATAITGMTETGDRTVEFREGKLLIYLSNFEAMSEDTLASLLLLFRIWWKMDHGDEEEVEEATQVAIRQVEQLLAEATRAKTAWRLHKARMNEALRWIEETVETTESRLRATLNVLQGSVETVAVPPGLFRDPAGDAGMVADIQTILRAAVASAGPTDSVTLNDLADAFATERKMSRDAAKTHLRAVLLDSVIETPRGKSALVRGLKLKESL